MKRISGVLLICCLLFSFFSLSSQLCSQELKSKKVLFIIASSNFRDEELLKPLAILKKEGIKTMVASSSLRKSRGMLGTEITPDILLQQVNVDDYNAIVFVGGTGAKEYWENPVAHRIAKEAYNKGKLLGAICIAPVILAKAKLLKNKKVTGWPSTAPLLKKSGAIYSGKDVQIDSRIITAKGPQASKDFGETILSVLK